MENAENVAQADINNGKQPEEKDKGKQQAYDCNICFDDVVDPVVTRCGHLFCWACLLTWMNRPNDHCPVCHAGITKENVIPLYGRGQEETDPRQTSEPRPKAERPEARQQQNGRGSIFGGMTISMFAFPFSIVLPISLAGAGGMGSFRFVDIMSNNENMTPEQRRAQLNSAILMTMGLAMIAYIVLVL
ncbi:hypothetical protein X943_000399 [Babesia divergens]|uniref:RING-type E3 ubiquitin transferase n=1 Tax=Babesia divergens TaxID=32595 RepID=A0AAD9G6F4_BABDI|nr:hypothetical protein X943_000399 [Babesia divergens]